MEAEDIDEGAVVTANATVENPSHREIKTGDLISSLPDEILHHILSFIPTYTTIRTSLLSKRWRYLWCETPSLDFSYFRRISQTLIRYKAAEITSFTLPTSYEDSGPQIDWWIQFAIDRNVQKLFIVVKSRKTYIFPDSFFVNSFVKQISLDLDFSDRITRSDVCWSSLKKLSLSRCEPSSESIAKILSGFPVLESLTLCFCGYLEHLDLSNSPTLMRLEIDRNFWADQCKSPYPIKYEVIPNSWVGPTVIVAPHIRYLRLTNCVSRRACALVDVSSLTEANLDFRIDIGRRFKARSLQTLVLKMLAMFQNVVRLTFGETVLQILSLAELRAVHFPVLKVETLTVETMVVRSVIPGLARLLQNSPGLKKLIVHVTDQDKMMKEYLGSYLDSEGTYFNTDQCWKSKCKVFPKSWDTYSTLVSKEATLKLLASFIEVGQTNTKTLETMVVSLEGETLGFDDAKWLKEQLQMVPVLSHNINVSIVPNEDSNVASVIYLVFNLLQNFTMNLTWRGGIYLYLNFV